MSSFVYIKQLLAVYIGMLSQGIMLSKYFWGHSQMSRFRTSTKQIHDAFAQFTNNTIIKLRLTVLDSNLLSSMRIHLPCPISLGRSSQHKKDISAASTTYQLLFFYKIQEQS